MTVVETKRSDFSQKTFLYKETRMWGLFLLALLGGSLFWNAAFGLWLFILMGLFAFTY